MATINQQKAATAVLESIGKTGKINGGKLLKKAGYSDAIAKNPKMVLESKGFKEAMAALGLTEDLIGSSLVRDIKAKPGKRFLELSLGAEILNMKKRIDPEADKTPHQTIIIINTPQAAVAIKQ